MSTEGTPNEDEIRGLILSWRIMDAVELALSDTRVLHIIMKFLKDGDEATRTRAFMALNEVIKRGDERVRFIVVSAGFGLILEGLVSGDSKVAMKAARTLKNLVEGFPLSDDDVIKLIHAITPFIKRGRDGVLSAEIFDVVSHLRVLHPSPQLRSEISKLTSSRDPRIRAIGLRLLFNLFLSTGDAKTLKFLLDSAEELLSEKDPLLLDFVLALLINVFSGPLPAGIVKGLLPLLDRIKTLAVDSEDFIVKSKAREVAHAIEDFLYSYYSSRPEEAKEKIHDLIVRGDINAAVDLALATGDEFILKWLEGVLKARGVRMSVSARMIPGPVRNPQKKRLVFMPPPLTQMAPSRKTRIRTLGLALGGSENTPSHERMSVDVARAVAEGNVELLLEAIKSNPSTLEKLRGMLKDPETRADTLWVLQKVSSRVNGREALTLEPLVDELFEILLGGSPWQGPKAARILAVVSAEGGRRDIAERFLELMDSHPLASLQFFGYYLLRVCDPEIAEKVLEFVGGALLNPGLQFDALLALEAVSIKCPDMIGGELTSKLKDVAASAGEESSRIARRILNRLGK